MNQAIVKSTRYEGVNFHGRFESLLRIQSGKSPSFVLLIRQRTTREERRCLSVSKSGGKIGFERGIFISERRLNSQEFARLRPSAGFSLVTGHFPFFRILALIVDDIRCETLRFELSIQFPLSLSLSSVWYRFLSPSSFASFWVEESTSVFSFDFWENSGRKEGI